MAPSSKPVLYHNPRCTKSRQALALLEDSGVEVVPERVLEIL
jgi:arsenate reductase-like glutaredoxin family protein